MALLFCDSFDHYATADRGEKYQTIGSGGAITGGAGRTGSAWVATNQNHNMRRALGVNAGTLIAGTAFKLTGDPANIASVLAFFDDTTEQISVRINASSKILRVSRAGTDLEVGSTVLADNTWYYIELKALIANAGTYELRINGVVEVDGSADTQNTANAYANAIQIVGPTAGGNFGESLTWDDLYVCSSTDSGVSGAPNNDFLGDVTVQSLHPNGNGNSSMMVGSDGNSVDNYLLVDETAPNDDTDYVQGLNVDDKDTYNYGSLTATAGSVYGVQVLMHARKTDAGLRSICAVTRESGAEEDGADHALSTSYLYYLTIFENEPGGATDAWTIAEVNGAEYGGKVTI